MSGRPTLQKSILFTPLLPSAGPTGGLGDALPAPTISLTTWSFCIALRAMSGGGMKDGLAHSSTQLGPAAFTNVTNGVRDIRFVTRSERADPLHILTT